MLMLFLLYFSFLCEKRYDFFETVVSNAMSCDVKCSYMCNLCVFRVCFLVKCKFGTRGVHSQGSRSVCTCVKEHMKPQKACDHGPGAHDHGLLCMITRTSGCSGPI